MALKENCFSPALVTSSTLCCTTGLLPHHPLCAVQLVCCPIIHSVLYNWSAAHHPLCAVQLVCCPIIHSVLYNWSAAPSSTLCCTTGLLPHHPLCAVQLVCRSCSSFLCVESPSLQIYMCDGICITSVCSVQHKYAAPEFINHLVQKRRHWIMVVFPFRLFIWSTAGVITCM